MKKESQEKTTDYEYELMTPKEKWAFLWTCALIFFSYLVTTAAAVALLVYVARLLS